MYEPSPNDELLTLKEAEEQYEVKRSTLHRYVQKGRLTTYRRGMDKRVYVRRSELEALRAFRPSEPRGGLSMAAIERARAFQRRTFGDRALSTPSAQLIEEARNERTEELP